jgi:molybdopterin/thiamine biosynthesis adenylyltransferase
LDSYERYLRQLPLLGKEGQRRLREAKVAVIGLGGLGTNVALQLALLGIGELLLVDHDIVSITDLNRQVLYSTKDVGRPKVLVAEKRITELNPEIKVKTYNVKLTEENVDEVLKGYDVIVDCLDNWRSRLVLDKHIWKEGKILVHGAVDGFYGQVTTIKRGETTCLSCLSGVDKDEIPSISPAVSLVSSLQSLEVLKVVTGLSRPLFNVIAVIDVLEPSISLVRISPLDCGLCPKLS